MKSSLYCLLMLSLASSPLAYSQEMKNKICSKDRCVYYPTTLPEATNNTNDNTNKKLPEINKIKNKIVSKQLPLPTSTVYKYRNQEGKWVYADHLPETKSLVYYIVDEQ